MKVVKKIKTFYVQKPFSETCAIYETTWKKYGRARQADRWQHNVAHALCMLDMFVKLRTTALRLIVWSWLDVPTFATRRLHVCHHARAPIGGRWNCGREMSENFAKMTTSTPFRDLLHAIKLRHGTDSFTSPLKEGVLRIFLP